VADIRICHLLPAPRWGLECKRIGRAAFPFARQESGTMDRIGWLLLPVSLGLSSFVATTNTAFAEAPRVRFDMPYAIACRDVTPPKFTDLYPGYKLMEAKLEISSLLAAGQEKDLTQFFVRVESPAHTLVITDYLPKTKHEANASSVTKEDSTERAIALGINMSEKYELLTLPGPSAGIGQTNKSSIKYELLPPLETVAASGTLDRGNALFFKIKSSPRNLLEGTREYGLVFKVPANWRADYLRIRCEAEGIRRNIISTFDEQITCGNREFLVALYQDGDEAARRLAENFARREAAKLNQASSANPQSRPGESASRRPYDSSPWAAIQR
jgi:hypothetical protein